jgi:TetR/AcrR family transcriptional regulator, fatty acid biosynthesis regulator
MSSSGESHRKREQASRALMQAALEISAATGYGSLSLRSVARGAGIAPTSFYRNFRDLDELGLALVNEGRLALQQCLEKARRRLAPAAPARGDRNAAMLRVARPWSEAFLECAAGHGPLLRLYLQERTGSSLVLRAVVAGGFAQAEAALLGDLGRLGLRDRPAVAAAMLRLAAAAALEALVEPERGLDEAVDALGGELALLLTGAAIKEGGR